MKKLKPIVVVVDADPAIRDSLRFSLEVEGFAVCEYPAGVDLLKDVERTAVDCLVLDEQISGMSGSMRSRGCASATSRFRPC
jgi:FixJ family two-component response regulator